MSQLPLLFGLGSLAAAGLAGASALRKPESAGRSGVAHITAIYRADAPVTAVVEPEAVSTMSPILDRFRRMTVVIAPARSTGKIQRSLDRAGNPPNWTLDRVLAFKSIAMIGLCAFALIVGMGRGAAVILFLVAGAVAGFLVPDLLVYNAGVKRQEDIERALPDAMDMLTVCVEAGLGFDAALTQVARNTEGALTREFARVLQEMQFGKSRTEALQALSERTTVSELRAMVLALIQAAKLGIPIAAVLREQGKEMRLKRRQRAEEKAQKVTVKILFPLIFCLLPALFIVVMGPGVLTLVKSLSGV
ncbi:MAG TPA: type II secretion system F family protein [Jatrophihabitans sp.]|jgi:tight adherence protein C|nr:type II secretion system F family protein [Jatrophihabitans sp.]